MRVSQIMTRPVETAALDESVEVARERMRLKKIHHLVVKEGGRIVGVLSAHDVDSEMSGRVPVTVGDVMTPFPVRVRESASVRRAANLMRGWTVGCLPVVDAKDKLIGIVTASDLLELLGRGGARPVPKGTRWTLKQRAPTRSPHVPAH